MLIGSLCNVAFAIYELLQNSVDFNTHILVVFMINLFVYSGFYVIMKVRKNECIITRVYPFVHLAASITFWTTGSVFFLQKSAKWEVSSPGLRLPHLPPAGCSCASGPAAEPSDLLIRVRWPDRWLCDVRCLFLSNETGH